MSAINNIIESEESTCTGDAVKAVFSGKNGRSDAVIVHNPGALSLWYKITTRSATAPTTSTFTATQKMGIILPGETKIVPMNINGAALYLMNDSGASTTNEYCAYATDGGVPA